VSNYRPPLEFLIFSKRKKKKRKKNKTNGHFWYFLLPFFLYLTHPLSPLHHTISLPPFLNVFSFSSSSSSSFLLHLILPRLRERPRLRETPRERSTPRERTTDWERERCRPKRRKKRRREEEEEKKGFSVMGPYEVKCLVFFIFSWYPLSLELEKHMGC